MTLPAHQIDVWTPATDSDKLKALASFAGMPAQRSTSPAQAEIVDASYFAALEGVTRHGLVEAVKFILRGSLKHAFFPSPPELRMEHDKAMKWHENQRVKVLRQEQISAERPTQVPPITPDARARHEERMRRFHAGYEKEKAEDTFVLDPALVALVPDNPKAMIHQRKGSSA